MILLIIVVLNEMKKKIKNDFYYILITALNGGGRQARNYGFKGTFFRKHKKQKILRKKEKREKENFMSPKFIYKIFSLELQLNVKF